MERRSLPFAVAARYWLTLGFLSFGGPAGQIALMHRELVERRKWISESRFLHALNFCMVLPGPEAQQLATYIGWRLNGVLGGITAGGLFVLPGFVITVALAWTYMALGHVAAVAAIFYGVKPAVTAIVLQALVRIGSRALRHWTLWLLAGAAFVALAVLHVPFPLIVFGAAGIGIVGGKAAPKAFAGSGHGAAAADARFRWTRLMLVFACGLTLWALPLLGLTAAFGWSSPPVVMAIFFTKTALLTFGGAYAVLPYVTQNAISHGWLTAPQMIDGLALGETTPGPLIMIVTFVGFAGGWHSGVFGNPLLAGLVCATVVTWFTFLPSFVFVLAGAPVVESTRGDARLSAPLTAITAAVVGVIANLAVFFARHVLWPEGFGARFDLLALATGLAAAFALLVLRWNLIVVLVLCAVAGLVYKVGFT